MALVQKQNTKRTVIILSVFMTVIVGGIIALLVLRPKESLPTDTTGIGRGTDLPILKDFGEDLYTSDQMKQLRDFSAEVQPGDLAPPPGNPRNPNPFEPL